MSASFPEPQFAHCCIITLCDRISITAECCAARALHFGRRGGATRDISWQPTRKKKKPKPLQAQRCGRRLSAVVNGGQFGGGGGGIAPPLESDATKNQACGCGFCRDPGAAPALHSCGSNCQFMATIAPDLQSVIAAWAQLPESIRRGITGLVRSQEGSEP